MKRAQFPNSYARNTLYRHNSSGKCQVQHCKLMPGDHSQMKRILNRFLHQPSLSNVSCVAKYRLCLEPTTVSWIY